MYIDDDVNLPNFISAKHNREKNVNNEQKNLIEE
jgi:hypothetical protein